MSNYPPGVTGNEPQIAGFLDHLGGCPGHEDYQLSEVEEGDINPADVLRLMRALEGFPAPGSLEYIRGDIRKAMRPFLWMLECRCDEIERAMRENAAERRAKERADA